MKILLIAKHPTTGGAAICLLQVKWKHCEQRMWM